ncbi:unnamed protein product [Penicillium bialowiezense]
MEEKHEQSDNTTGSIGCSCDECYEHLAGLDHRHLLLLATFPLSNQGVLTPPGSKRPISFIMAQPVILQSDLLPSEVKDVELPEIKKLDTVFNIELWKLNVKFTLRPLLLHKLIRHDLARPEETHATYETWYYYSGVVAGWLYLSVSEDIQRRLRNNGAIKSDNLFADTMMKKIEEIVRGEGIACVLFAKIDTLRAIKRSQYDSVHDFILAAQTLIQELRDTNVTIPMICPVAIILDELKDELPEEVAFIRYQLWNLFPKDFTQEKFSEICRTLRDAGKAAAEDEDVKKTRRRRRRGRRRRRV